MHAGITDEMPSTQKIEEYVKSSTVEDEENTIRGPKI